MAGLPTPLIAVQEGTILAVTPFGLPLNQNVSLVVTVNGVQIKDTLSTPSFAPGLCPFLLPDGTATAAAINQDGTVNSQANPAPPGSVIAFYATGLGQTDPPSNDGQAVESIGARYLSDVRLSSMVCPALYNTWGQRRASSGRARSTLWSPRRARAQSRS
jgi:uncharacterized protein (TIGR03437 family)